MCIRDSYLTIDLKGSIPVEFRHLIGNRIFGCDDCQLVCPWNSISPSTEEVGYTFKPEFVSPMLVGLLHWDSDQFERLTAGTALRRINHEQWLRNVAVALGNGPATLEAISALKARVDHPSAMVREHIEWALARLDS